MHKGDLERATGRAGADDADLVERVALDCRITTEAPDVAATLLAGQGGAGEARKRGVVSGEGKPARWGVKA